MARDRGAAVAPEPSIEPSDEPSAALADAREVQPAAEAARGGGSADSFFAALGDTWRLTAAQRARLAPVVDAAVDSGWQPAELAAFAGANANGVRNPYAVLASRMSPTELPVAIGNLAARRPPWCGKCDERTRRREKADGMDAGRCAACHPLAAEVRSPA